MSGMKGRGMDEALYQPIASRGEFQAAIRSAFDDAADQGCREIWLCDADFADWPLGEKAVIAALTRWAQAHRRLLLVAQSYDEFARRHPRWVEWRRIWSHVVECKAIADLEPGQMPSVLLSLGRRCVRRVDPVRFRGSVADDAVALTAARESIDAIAQRSEDAFPVTTLGI
jgi:hypothetical protein